MKLSESLLVAHDRYKQAFYVYVYGNHNFEPVHVCAIAAHTMASRSDEYPPYELDEFDRKERVQLILQETGVNLEEFIELPGGMTYSLYTALMVMNDEYKWNFQRMADFFKSRGR